MLSTPDPGRRHPPPRSGRVVAGRLRHLMRRLWGRLWGRLSRRRVRAEQSAAASEAQLAVLRAQLDPHFLFNTLNAISSLVVTARAAEAEEMLDRLSSFLRATLTTNPARTAPLEAELRLARTYLEIERVRFGDRLAVEILCAPDAALTPVPRFLLQPLVENAVVDGVGPARGPVTVRIGARMDAGELMLTVADDGARRVASDLSPRDRLTEVRQRLRTLYGSGAALVAVPRERGLVATMRLPARELEQAA